MTTGLEVENLLRILENAQSLIIIITFSFVIFERVSPIG